MPIIQEALRTDDAPILSAGLKPTLEQLQLFAKVNGFKVRQTIDDYREARSLGVDPFDKKGRRRIMLKVSSRVCDTA